MKKENKDVVFIHEKERKTYPAIGIMVKLKGERDIIMKNSGEQVYLFYDRLEIVKYNEETRNRLVIPFTAISWWSIETEKMKESGDDKHGNSKAFLP